MTKQKESLSEQIAKRIKQLCKNIYGTKVVDNNHYFTKDLVVYDVYSDYMCTLDEDNQNYRTTVLCKADDFSSQFILSIPLSLIHYNVTLEGLYVEYVGTNMTLNQKDAGIHLLETI